MSDAEKPIRVLVVEDSPTAQEMLVHILNSDPRIHVVGTADDGESAVSAAARLKPDVISMDIYMPGMNGLEATRRIMETDPVPIVIVSAGISADDQSSEISASFRAIDAGAVAVVRKPPGQGHREHETTVRELLQTIKAMSEVKLVRRQRKKTGASLAPPALPRLRQDIRLVAMGASTGGPAVLRKLLSGLPKTFPATVLIVQHMTEGFTEGFAAWLAQATGFPVQLATDGAKLLTGHAYVAPDGWHMILGANNRIRLTRDAPINGFRPSVSSLFRSVAMTSSRNAVGVLLTGMGKDGAEELGMMKKKGAITIAQDAESSTIFGMPGEAVKNNVAQYVLPPEEIAGLLTRLVSHQERKNGL